MVERAGLIYDDSVHYLDHLAPLCVLLNWPLILCDPSIVKLAQTFYPGLQIIEKNLRALKLPKWTLSCDSALLLKSAFPKQTTITIWLPHGQSDKGLSLGYAKVLEKEHLICIYGQNMKWALTEKSICSRMIFVGNFRLNYFKSHQTFYQNSISIPNFKKTILYAPSWDDYETKSSFWSSFTNLVKKLPKNFLLILKLHPNTIKKFKPEVEALIGPYVNWKNFLFLEEFPPIYPLLNHCDAYIGDTSSIGYDFLYFDRPMFFLNALKKRPLHGCGTPIDATTFNYSLNDNLSSFRKRLYSKTFSSTSDWEKLKQKLLCAL